MLYGLIKQYKHVPNLNKKPLIHIILWTLWVYSSAYTIKKNHIWQQFFTVFYALDNYSTVHVSDLYIHILPTASGAFGSLPLPAWSAQPIQAQGSHANHMQVAVIWLPALRQPSQMRSLFGCPCTAISQLVFSHCASGPTCLPAWSEPASPDTQIFFRMERARPKGGFCTGAA